MARWHFPTPAFLHFPAPRLLLPTLLILLLSGFLWSCGGGGQSAEPLNPEALYSQDCSYLTSEELNTMFDGISSTVQNPVAPVVTWEFNDPGSWSFTADSCAWRSSNTPGVSVIVLATEIPADTDFNSTSDTSYLIRPLDDFASVDERFAGVLPADEFVTLAGANYGEGGIAMRWNLFIIHSHIIFSNAPSVEIQLETEQQTELALAKYLLRRIEAFGDG